MRSPPVAADYGQLPSIFQRKKTTEDTTRLRKRNCHFILRSKRKRPTIHHCETQRNSLEALYHWIDGVSDGWFELGSTSKEILDITKTDLQIIRFGSTEASEPIDLPFLFSRRRSLANHEIFCPEILIQQPTS